MAEDQIVQGIIPVPQRDVTLLLEAGYLYMELGKNKEAEDVFSGVSALIPHSEVPHMALGNLYFSMGRFTPALKSHQRAAELNPGSAAAHASIGETFFFLKKPKDALQSVEKAMSLEPDGPAGQFAKYLKEAHELGIFG
jgi:tetratricopeptide (TPR) repeat protein